MTTSITGYDGADALVQQSDGKLVAAGDISLDIALVRYLADGSLDQGFGDGGKVTTPIGGEDLAQAVIQQSDGKLVAAGFAWNGTDSDFALVRYSSDGSLDTSFGNSGKVTTPIGSSHDAAVSMVQQPDGKLVVAGGSFGELGDFALVRYNVDGSLDESFGEGGKVTTPIGSGADSATGLLQQADGKLVVFGWADSGVLLNDFAVVRYNTNGSLDGTFGNGGKVTTDIGHDDSAFASVLQTDGKLLVAGTSWTGSDYDVALVRYDDDGSLDSSFGSAGIVTTSIASSDEIVRGMVQQPDGKLVVAGHLSNRDNPPFDWDVMLLRYDSDGNLDSDFGDNGKVRTSIGSDLDSAEALVRQADGKLVVAGWYENGTDTDFFIMRYQE